MTKRAVQGEDIVMTLADGTVLHATSHNLKVDLALKDFRTKDTDGIEKSPGDVTWSADGDGLVVVGDEATGKKSSEDVLGLLLNKTKVAVVLKAKLAGSLSNTYTGNAYVTSFSLSTSAGEDASFSYTLTGTGKLTPAADTTNVSQQQQDQTDE